MKVLIIEDAKFMALGFKDSLTEQGHDVDWIIGVRSFAPFVGIDGSERDVAMDPTIYDVVLCDGQTFGPNEGPAIVLDLAGRGVTCVGISSTPDYNNEMVRNGATMGLMKVCAFAAVVENVLKMEQCRQPSPELPAQVQAFEHTIRSDQTLRRKLDGIIQKHMD